MLKSMTGYGYARRENPEFSITVEIKSLNSKFLDVNFRLPSILAEKEIEIKNMLENLLERGKISIQIKYVPKDINFGKVSINAQVVKQYYLQLKEIIQELNASENNVLATVMSLPDVYASEHEAANMDLVFAQLLETTEEAIKNCDVFRLREGNSILQKMEEYIQKIKNLLIDIEKQDPERILYIREKLHKQIADFVQSEHFDRNRFEQELIYYMEKFDISEEKMRLKNHLDYFLEVLRGKFSNGKKLNFISQEIGREINTIGSKANDATIQRLVVEMKDELEKIKEQLQNVI